MADAALREQVARVLCDAFYCASEYDNLSQSAQRDWKRQADAVLAWGERVRKACAQVCADKQPAARHQMPYDEGHEAGCWDCEQAILAMPLPPPEVKR